MKLTDKIIFYGPKGMGKSTFLRMVRDVIDPNIEATQSELEEFGRIFQDGEQYVNSISTILLDFSGFDAKNMDETKAFCADLLATYCRENFTILDKRFKNSYQKYKVLLSILRKETDLYNFRWLVDNIYKELDKYAAVLLDNLVLAEMQAKKHGFLDELKEFLFEFIGGYDVAKYWKVYIQVGDIEYWSAAPYLGIWESTYSYSFQGIHPLKFNIPINHNIVLFEPVEKQLDELYYSEKMEWIRKCKQEDDVRELQRRKSEYELFHKDYCGENIFYTKFLNKRSFDNRYDTDAYYHLNDAITDIYRIKFSKKLDYYGVYRLMQNVNENTKTDWEKKNIQELKNFTLKHLCEDKIWSNDDFFWSYFKFFKSADSVGNSKQIKVYLSLKDLRIREIFIELNKFLIQYAARSFASKVTKVKRNDHICFWLYKEDFLLLEQFINKKSEHFVRSLDFVPYRGVIGISRDLSGAYSYNASIALIVNDYLESICNESDIDFCKMLDFFVRKWNYEKMHDNDYDPYKEGNCQMLLVILESMDLILSQKNLMDEHLLLNGDSGLWNRLCNACCWAEL